MANNLKGLTIKIGGDTSELDKALSGVNKKSKDLSSELSTINRMLKLDPSNVELVAQKQKVLAEAISNTEEKLATLREAEKQVQEQFEKGEVSEAQYRALQREIMATERQLDKYKKATEEAADGSEELAEKSKEAADGLDNTADKAKEADEALDSMGEAVGSAAKTGLTTLVTAATAAVAALVGLAESTREYRTEMGKLNTAFQDAEFSTEAAYETYADLQGILGETDQAVEAANHLAKLVDTEEELVEWTDICTGVYATFGDSLPIEGLTEAANETAKVAKVTGPLADALNWAGESEDAFNEALEACSDEQERQQLITKTLTKLYKGAATQYKNTNKEVIRANKANEEWNRTLADMGGYVEPLVTDVKQMGLAIAKDMKQPLREVVDFIRQKVLPALTNFGGWVKTNAPQITAAVAGVTAVIATHKAAVLAAELASKGLTVATLAQAAAQKALNLVMSASPLGLLTTAIAGAAAAMFAYNLVAEETTAKTDVLTAEERELMAAADETARAFWDQKQATEEALGNITAQMDNTQNLANELMGLADASGQVKEKDQERANFILNELNEALGTEYQMVDGVIQKYAELETNINEVIQAKLANSLVEAANADYVAAIQNEAGALENLNLKEQDYRAQLDLTKQAEQEYTDAVTQYETALDEARSENDYRALAGLANLMAEKRRALDEEKGQLDEKKTAYDQAAVDYGNYYNTIANYEDAQAAVLAGNFDKAVDLLARKGDAYGDFAGTVDQETAKVLNTLYKEAIDAGLEAQRTKENFEKGVDGYTKEMVTEAEEGYKGALDEFANAYADAEGVGGDLSDGLQQGMESKRSSLYAKATSLVSGIIAAMRTAADSHSPARKTIAFGEDVGEGAEIGIERKTDDVAKAATRQAAAVLDAYGSQELAAQRALSNITNRQAELDATTRRAEASTNSGILQKILTAIEAGQVLVLDGDALVGATAGRMDTTLGRRRVLAERGAL